MRVSSRPNLSLISRMTSAHAVGSQTSRQAVDADPPAVMMLATTSLARRCFSRALLYFYAHRGVTAWASAPAGCTLLTKQDTAVCCNSKTDTTSDGAITQTLTGSTVGEMTAVLEIVALS